MTTIAFRDGVLAALNDGDYRVGEVQKVRRVETLAGPVMFGLTGMWTQTAPFEEFLRTGRVADLLRRGRDDKNFFDALVVDRDGEVKWYTLDCDLEPPIEAPFFAIGSGRWLALGAMAHGATAVEAVEVACRFDSCSGGAVRSLSVRDL